MSPVYYSNKDTDDVVKYPKRDARLESLDNWEQLTDAQVEKLGEKEVFEPVQFSQIGEVSEDVNAHGAGVKHSPDGLNADKDDNGHADGNDPGKTAGDVERPTDANKVEEIDAYATSNEIDLGGAKTKAEKLALIDAWHEAGK